MGSSHGQQTIQGACVSETAVHDHGRRLNQNEFRPRAEVPFRPARQLSEYKGKGASASREPKNLHDGDGSREGRKTKALISKTTTLHVRYFWYISLPFCAQLQREMTKFNVLCRTQTHDGEFSFL